MNVYIMFLLLNIIMLKNILIMVLSLSLVTQLIMQANATIIEADEEKKPKPPISIMPICATIVSDTTTMVDQGYTIPINYTWNSPHYGSSTSLGISGATAIWSSNGFNTGNPYTFTKSFILPPNNAYSATLYINADDQWKDLYINGYYIASESVPPSGWGDVHTYNIGQYLQPGLNTLEVKALDIKQVVAALAFKIVVTCTPIQGSTHWDKIIFTIDIGPINNATGIEKLRPLIGKTLDIKVRDSPAEIAVLEDKIKAFLAAKYNLTQNDLNLIRIKIINVEYAIDTSTAGKKITPVTQTETGVAKDNMNNYLQYLIPIISISGLSTVLLLRYKKRI